MKYPKWTHRLRSDSTNIKTARAATLAVLMVVAAVGLGVALRIARQASPSHPRPALQPRVPPADEHGAAASEPDADDPDGRADWFTYQRAYPFEAIPADARRRAWEALAGRVRTEANVEASTVRTWRSIGPSPTSPAYFSNWGLTSGRINAIAISPVDASIVLAGSSTGGIWRSSDGGETFAPVSDDQVDLAVGSLAFAPSRPTVVYAGMGDTKLGYLGSGVLKSNDAGRTWARVNNSSLPSPGTAAKIDVDPANPDRVYVAQYSRLAADKVVSSGFYVSADGGVSWTKTAAGAARDIAINPANPRTIFVGMSRLDATDPPVRVLRSSDAGATWTTSLTGDSNDLRFRRDSRVAISPTDPRRIYAYYGGVAGGSLVTYLKRSTDSGSSWTDLGTSGFDTLQFGYNTYLAADPGDANTIYVGSRDLFRSIDGGASWTSLTGDFTFNGSFYEYTPFLSKAHPDQHALAFVPGSASQFYLGCDGGIYKTNDRGNSFRSLNRTLTLTQFTSIAIHPTDANVTLGGTQDNGTQRRNTSDNSWYEVFTGDGGRVVINPFDPNIAYITYIRGDIYRYTGAGLFYDLQIASTGTFGESESTPRVAFYPPLVGNGVDTTLYFGTWRLFTYTDATFSWVPPAGDLDLTKGVTANGSDVLSAIGVSRSNTNVIYTGSVQGRAMASTDAGATWRDVTGTLPNRSISCIKVDPANPAVAYLTTSGFGSGHVFKTSDGGAAWQDISGDLPDVPASTLLIDPLNPNGMFIGSDIGVFRSSGTGTWQLLGKGMPPVVVTELTAQASGLIQAATYGRGAFELSPITPPAIASVTWNGAKLLVISGSGFDSSARLAVNNVDRTDFIRSTSDSAIRVKAKAKALGLTTGDNTIRVTNSDGTTSNVFVLRI